MLSRDCYNREATICCWWTAANLMDHKFCTSSQLRTYQRLTKFQFHWENFQTMPICQDVMVATDIMNEFKRSSDKVKGVRSPSLLLARMDRWMASPCPEAALPWIPVAGAKEKESAGRLLSSPLVLTLLPGGNRRLTRWTFMSLIWQISVLIWNALHRNNIPHISTSC